MDWDRLEICTLCSFKLEASLKPSTLLLPEMATTFELRVCVEPGNLSSLAPTGGVDSPDFAYFFKLRCYTCSEISNEITTHIGDEPLRYRCKACRTEGRVSLLPGHGQPMVFDSPSPAFTPLVRFEVTEFEPVEYCFNGGWTGRAKNGEELELNLIEIPTWGILGDESSAGVTKASYCFKIVR